MPVKIESPGQGLFYRGVEGIRIDRQTKKTRFRHASVRLNLPWAVHGKSEVGRPSEDRFFPIAKGPRKKLGRPGIADASEPENAVG